MVLARANPLVTVKTGLSLVQMARENGLGFNKHGLRRLERGLREQALVGFARSGRRSASDFSLDERNGELLQDLIGNESIQKQFRGRAEQLANLCVLVDRSLGESLAMSPVPQITPADIVLGAAELVHRFPEAQTEWSLKNIRSALDVWWGYQTNTVRTILRKDGVIADVRELDPVIADFLEGKDVPRGGVTAARLVETTLAIMTEQPELTEASYNKRSQVISMELGLSARSLQNVLMQRPELLVEAGKIDEDAVSFIGKPMRRRAKKAKPMTVSVFIRRARKAIKDGVSGFHPMVREIGKGWYSSANQSARRYEALKSELELLAPDVVAAIGERPERLPSRPSVKPMTPREFVNFAHRIMADDKFNNAAQAKKLQEISSLKGHADKYTARERYRDAKFKAAVERIDPKVAEFIGELTFKAKPMPVKEFVRRVRRVMESGFRGRLMQRFSAISEGWYSDPSHMLARFSSPYFLKSVLKVDRDVAYWVHPRQADLVRMYVEWRDAGGALVSPNMTPQDVLVRLRADRRILAGGNKGGLLESAYWMVVGEDLIDLSRLNRGLPAYHGLEGAVMLFRDLKILFAGASVGTNGAFRNLASVLDVSVNDLNRVLMSEEVDPLDESQLDMKRVFKLHASLIGDYSKWHEQFIPFGNRFGQEYGNLLHEALYHAAKAVIAAGVRELHEVHQYATRAVANYLITEWWRVKRELPVLGDDNRAFQINDYRVGEQEVAMEAALIGEGAMDPNQWLQSSVAIFQDRAVLGMAHVSWLSRDER